MSRSLSLCCDVVTSCCWLLVTVVASAT
jgi:hypothetical protein